MEVGYLVSEMADSRVERLEIHHAVYGLKDIGSDNSGFSLVYCPGNTQNVSIYCVRIFTSGGVVGEYVGGNGSANAQVKVIGQNLVGKDVHAREWFYNNAKRGLRKYDKMGIGLLDIALWDAAGKIAELPVYKMLGGWRTGLPCYASTMSGDRNGGLDSPRKYADFAVQCMNLGYRGFKLHTWDDAAIGEIIEAVHTVREAVGAGLDLMLDPACKLQTFLDAVRVGRACDDCSYLWLEDPYMDGGTSIEGHRRLANLIRTPILMTEHVRGLEAHVDAIAGMATSVVRVDPEYDGGITGAMKICHAAEGFGLDVEIHSPGPANRAIMAAIRNTNYYEMSLVHPLTPEIGRPNEVYLEGCYRDSLDEIDSEGCVSVPSGPGLGIVYDWDSIERHCQGHVVFS